jgi:hypothetical protein
METVPLLDRPVHGRARKRLALPGGVILFLAMFLPATRVCGDRELTGLNLLRFPPLGLPYLIGVVAALVVLAPIVRGLRAPAIALQIVTVLAMAFWGVLAHWGVLAAKDPVPAGLASMAWWVAVCAFVPALSRRWSWEQRASRTLGVIGFACAAWFAFFLVFDPGIRYGSFVAFVGAVMLGMGGVAWEAELERAGSSTRERAIVTAVARAPHRAATARGARRAVAGTVCRPGTPG